MKQNVKDVIQDLRDSGYRELYIGVFPQWENLNAGFRGISSNLERYNYTVDVEVSCYGKGRENYIYVFLGEGWDEK